MPNTESLNANEQYPVKVLYVAGTGRSGSTLLGRLLGQTPGTLMCGEVWQLWHPRLRLDQLCECGSAIAECELWRQVFAEAFDGTDALQALQTEAQSVIRTRYMPYLTVLSGVAPDYEARRAELGEKIGKFYDVLAAVSGSQMIVDISKTAPYAFFLSRLPQVDLRLVHLIRDSRGVAYSWTKKRLKPDVVHERSYLHRYHPLESALRWNVNLAFFSWYRRSGNPYLRIYYEDLIAEPDRVLGDILSFADHDSRVNKPEFVSGEPLNLIPAHGISGNPNRFERRPVVLREDVEWKNRMRGFDQATVTMTTLPGLIGHGYLSLRHRRRAVKNP